MIPIYSTTVLNDYFKKGIVNYFGIDTILVFFAWFCALHSLHSISDI